MSRKFGYQPQDRGEPPAPPKSGSNARRPVVRGKWVNYGDEYRPDIKCCVCGQRKPILLGNFNFNFCPNCGADMREEN